MRDAPFREASRVHVEAVWSKGSKVTGVRRGYEMLISSLLYSNAILCRSRVPFPVDARGKNLATISSSSSSSSARFRSFQKEARDAEGTVSAPPPFFVS